ncbi:hypothetical protein ACULNC_04655 [Shigella flexneri]
MMVGRSLNQRFPDKENKPGEVILEVRNQRHCASRRFAMSRLICIKGRSSVSPGWWAKRTRILLRRYLVFARNRCTIHVARQTNQ